jgi:hypothetical protein
MSGDGDIEFPDFKRWKMNFAEGFKLEGVSVGDVMNDVKFLFAVRTAFNIGTCRICLRNGARGGHYK